MADDLAKIRSRQSACSEVVALADFARDGAIAKPHIGVMGVIFEPPTLVIGQTACVIGPNCCVYGGSFDPSTPPADELRFEVIKLAKRWKPKKALN